MKARALKNTKSFIADQICKQGTHNLTMGDIRKYISTIVSDQHENCKIAQYATMSSVNEPSRVFRSEKGVLLCRLYGVSATFSHETENGINTSTLWFSYNVELVGKWTTNEEARKALKAMKPLKFEDKVNLEDYCQVADIKDDVKVRLMSVVMDYTTASEHSNSKDGSRKFYLAKPGTLDIELFPTKIARALRNQLNDFAWVEPTQHEVIYDNHADSVY